MSPTSNVPSDKHRRVDARSVGHGQHADVGNIAFRKRPAGPQPLRLYGFQDRPSAALDSVVLAPGETASSYLPSHCSNSA